MVQGQSASTAGVLTRWFLHDLSYTHSLERIPYLLRPMLDSSTRQTSWNAAVLTASTTDNTGVDNQPQRPVLVGLQLCELHLTPTSNLADLSSEFLHFLIGEPNCNGTLVWPAKARHFLLDIHGDLKSSTQFARAAIHNRTSRPDKRQLLTSSVPNMLSRLYVYSMLQWKNPRDSKQLPR